MWRMKTLIGMRSRKSSIYDSTIRYWDSFRGLNSNRRMFYSVTRTDQLKWNSVTILGEKERNGIASRSQFYLQFYDCILTISLKAELLKDSLIPKLKLETLKEGNSFLVWNVFFFELINWRLIGKPQRNREEELEITILDILWRQSEKTEE